MDLIYFSKVKTLIEVKDGHGIQYIFGKKVKKGKDTLIDWLRCLGGKLTE